MSHSASLKDIVSLLHNHINFNFSSLRTAFLGIDKVDWLGVRPEHLFTSTYFMPGAANSIASGRLSYSLGLEGPCVTYDTACSSALVAAQGGLRFLQVSDCEAALVEGVNVNLTPSIQATFFIAGLASLNGRSHVSKAFPPIAGANCRLTRILF